MGFVEWANKGLKKLDFWDLGLTKLGVLFATLVLVKWWPAIASLDWPYYLVIALLASARPLYRFFTK